ncbi:MAG: thiamine pyrophosphate-dependent enzyme [Candidatus Cloacimonadales bacterium]
MQNLERITPRNIDAKEYFYGHKACAGCGCALAVRLALKVIGDGAFSILPAGCMSAVGFIYPQMAFVNNSMISTFPGAASLAAGVAAGNKALKREGTKTVVFAGDGGTADIGLQALSGMIDRDDDVLYICYDNEAYMNTGIQKSGLTPFGAKTTTTPAGEHIHGTQTNKKRLFEIIAAHDIKYAATASIGYYQDYINKVQKAASIKGATFIHVACSCPTGWGTPTETSVEIMKEAVDNGLWFLAEYENHKFTLNHNPKVFTLISEYIKKQGRFKHLNEHDIKTIELYRDKMWERMREEWKNN